MVVEARSDRYYFTSPFLFDYNQISLLLYHYLKLMLLPLGMPWLLFFFIVQAFGGGTAVAVPRTVFAHFPRASPTVLPSSSSGTAHEFTLFFCFFERVGVTLTSS